MRESLPEGMSAYEVMIGKDLSPAGKSGRLPIRNDEGEERAG